MTQVNGRITGVSGNMITVAFEGNVTQNEVGYAVKGSERLKSEVIRINENAAYLQVFESTKGLAVGDTVEFSGAMLSVQLGPGLLGQIYDGLQNPLPELAEQFGFFLPRGVVLDALGGDREWHFTPSVKKGDKLRRGGKVGTVPETQFKHHILVPFDWQGEWTVESIVAEGDYSVRKPVAVLKDQRGNTAELRMQFE
jgi:V/A-type H+-transporting ATPase subunit A